MEAYGERRLTLVAKPPQCRADMNVMADCAGKCDAKLSGGKFQNNTLITEQKGAAADWDDYENPEGVFSPHGDSIPALQRRGVVFLACHNAIWELAEKLIATGTNPDELSHGALAAELTDHLIAGAVLTPGIAGTLLELQRAGFNYANSA